MLPLSLFERTMRNGERKWLIYSPSTGNVYCLPCKLLGIPETSHFSGKGFSEWKNSQSRVQNHENSVTHKVCIKDWSARSIMKQRIDRELVKQVNAEKNYWNNISSIHFLLSIWNGLVARVPDIRLIYRKRRMKN